MFARRLKNLMWMVFVAAGLFSLVWATYLRAEDVYNFYFQKGDAPKTVIQSGGGQTATQGAVKQVDAAFPVDDSGERQPRNPAPEAPTLKAPVVVPAPVAAPGTDRGNDARHDTNRFSLGLGYAGISDPIGSGRAYTLGFRFNFNRFLGMSAQGRLRDLGFEDARYEIDDPRSSRNRIGGLLALVLTPLRLDLFGHRFLDLAAFAGGESSRRIERNGRDVEVGLEPVIGAAALLSFNENFGLELQVSKSTKAAFIGASVALMF